MARLNLDQYSKYMRAAPRTRGFGAFLVYDRQKANLLLMQEHILRADKQAWIEPVSGEKQTENGKFSRLSDFAFGAPVLSFENSNISSSRAALSIPVVGGKLTEWSREPGAELPTLVGITHMDPLTAPRVKMNIKLSEGAGGVVDEDGRVYLDLSESSGYSFEVSQWEELNTKLGELIEEKFKDPERGEQIWELNKLAPVEGSLNPTSFRVRTHSLAKAGSTVASTNQADLEEGAVIVGLEFNGGRDGSFPDEDGDMPFLLPERDAGEPYTMNIILGDEVWIKAVLQKLWANAPDFIEGEFEWEKDSKNFVVGGVGGRISLRAEAFRETGDYGVYVGFSHYTGGACYLRRSEENLEVGWRLQEASSDLVVVSFWLEGQLYKVNVPATVNALVKCPMKMEVEGGTISVSKGTATVSFDFHVDYENDQVLKAVSDMKGEITSKIKQQLEAAFESMVGKIEIVDLLRFNGLLFRNGQRSTAERVEAPGDISMLGELAPTLTAFGIDPIEKRLIAGGTQQLTLTPKPQPGETVTWEVKALPDDPEAPVGPEKLGEVVNEVYKAPKAETIAGRFRQVIITATVGDSSSSALFTIVPKAVAVRPNLQNALFSLPGVPQRYVLEGGSVESVLDWTTGTGFKGELRDPLPSEFDELNIPRDKNTKVYVAPAKDPDFGEVLGALMHLDQVHVTGAGRTETIDITVLWHATTATLKVEAQGDALKLVLAVQSWGGGPVDLPPDQTIWFVAKGKGTLDETVGTYKPAADEGDYVIIAGVGRASGQWNYAVLPMPYTADEAKIFHEVNNAIKGTNTRVAHTAEQLQAMEEVKKIFGSQSVTRT